MFKMYHLIAIVIALACVGAEQVTNRTFVPYGKVTEFDESVIRIINGQAASYGEFPYQVALIFQTSEGTYLCGGSIISDRWILTAGHCATGALLFNVYIGGITISGTESGRQVVQSTTGIVHERYNSQTLNNDIALVQLPYAIDFDDRVQPIKLPDADDRVGEDVPLIVSGYGATADNAGVNSFLNFVDLTSVSNEYCRSIFGNTVSEETICAQGHPRESTCSGDSGGPLVTTDGVQVGVVSWVYAGSCSAGYPSGYMRTASFREWIREKSGV